MRVHRTSMSFRGLPYLVLLAVAFFLLLLSSKQEAAPSSVIITEFSDFQCPYCKRAASVVEQVRQTYGERVKVVFKQMPLPMHNQAFKAAQASVCAGEQGKFWEYHDRLFAGSDLSLGALQGIASDLALKQGEFNQCLESATSRASVERDMTEAEQLGVNGTPTFFINGQTVKGATTFDALKQEIDAALTNPQTNLAARESKTTARRQVSTGSGSDRVAISNSVSKPEQRATISSPAANGVTLSLATIDFGYQLVGTTSAQMVETVTNAGSAPLVVADISVSGRDRRDFIPTYSFTLPVTVAPGNAIAVNLAFTPDAPWRAGTRNAKLEIAEKKSSQYVVLTGIGATCGGPLPACSSGCADADGDGLNDAWEMAGGIDVNNDGAANDLLLSGADLYKPDVYLHYDYTYDTNHDHNPPPQAIQWMVDAFAAHGVNLHIDPQHNAIDESIARVVTLANSTDAACTGPNAISAQQLRETFPNLELLKPAYHYMVFGHYATCDPAINPATGQPYCSACPNDPENPLCGLTPAQKPAPGNLGTAEVFGNDAIVATQGFADGGLLPIPTESWAGLAMHELGHNLGLEHGGADCFNFKPNYVSVMNYNFYLPGIPVGASPGDSVPKSCNTDSDCTSGNHPSGTQHCSDAINGLGSRQCIRIDYSDREFNLLDENGATTGINEELGLQGGANNTDISWYKSVQYWRAPTNGSFVDFKHDGFVSTALIFDVSGDGQKNLLTTQNDWPNLSFSYQCQSTFAARPAPAQNQSAVSFAVAQPTSSNASLPNLSITDVTVSEVSCNSQAAVFNVTISAPHGKNVTVQYATANGSAIAGTDYTAVSGTLIFPRGSKAAQTIAVPIADVLIPGPNKNFFMNLSSPVSAILNNSKGTATIQPPPVAKCQSCNLSCDDGNPCTQDSCSPTLGCTHVNASATATPYCTLAGLGISPGPDPNFAPCNVSGEWVDSDGDGLSDEAEAQGYIDVNADGVFDSGVDVPLPGANPHVPDVYLHYDYVAAGDHDHNPPARSIQLVVEAFAAHGVNLHIDPNHHAIPEAEAKVITLLAKAPDYVPDPACAGPSAKSMQQLRARYTDVAMLTPAYHYVVFGHYSSCDTAEHCLHCAQDPECGGGTPPVFASGGSAEINGNDVIVSLGFFTDNAVPIPDEVWAGVFMHELGHNFGLKHGGPDCDNYKPNYLSVMSYNFYTTGILVGSAPGDSVAMACMTDADCGQPPVCPGPDCEAPPHCSATTHRCYRLDYSSFQYNNLNETVLNETIGLAGRPNSKDVTIWSTDGSNTFFGATNGAPIDWNKDGLYLASQHQDINGDASETSLIGSNDWATNDGLFTNLNFCFQCTNNFMDQIQAAAGTSLQELLQGGLIAKRTQPARQPTARSYWPMVLPAASAAGARKVSECP